MAKTKIKTIVTRTYETEDGREFTEKHEAEEWQTALDTLEEIHMLTSEYKPTDDVDRAFYVHIKDEAQLKAFRAMLADMDFTCNISKPGYYYYDEVSNDYINIEDTIERLRGLLDLLNK